VVGGRMKSQQKINKIPFSGVRRFVDNRKRQQLISERLCCKGRISKRYFVDF